MSEQTTESILDKLPLPKLEGYFEASKNKYWIKDSEEKWIPHVKDDVRQILEGMGYNAKPGKGKVYSEADRALADIRIHHNIVYAGPVAGCKAGVREDGPLKYLVTKGPELPEAKEGDWSLIHKLGTRLFGEKQFEYVLGWSKNAVRGLYTGTCKRGQLLVLAGPPGCGKSFWQNRVVTPMLGGRVARPMQYMTGATSFNEDIIQAEHLLLEDENSRLDLRTRREFGTTIKNFTVNVTQRVHGKGRDAFVVASSHWMTLSVNDEAENLGCMPPLDESLRDKIIVTKCSMAIDKEWPGTDDKLERFQTEVEAQVPAFIWYLLNEHQIRDQIADIRFGVRSYQDPELVAAIDGLAPECELEWLIDKCWEQMALEKKVLRRTSGDIMMELESHPDLGYRAKNLLRYPTNCGVYLERLNKKKPLKFIKPNPHARPRVWGVDFGADEDLPA